MEPKTIFRNTDNSKIVFLASVSVSIFWILGNVFNIYKNAILGVIFEILWLPIIILTLALPVISLVKWARERYNVRSLYLYSFLMIVLVLGVIQIYSQQVHLY